MDSGGSAELNDGWTTQTLKAEREGRGSNGPSNARQIENYNTKTMAARESQAVEGTRCPTTKDRKQSYKRGQGRRRLTKTAVLLSMLATVPTALAENCISLSGSTACPAFNFSSVSVTGTVADLLYVLFPPKRLFASFSTPANLVIIQPFLKDSHRHRLFRSEITFLR